MVVIVILSLGMGYSTLSQDITEEYLKGKWISYKQTNAAGDSLTMFGLPYEPRKDTLEFINDSLFFIYNSDEDSPFLTKYYLFEPLFITGQRVWNIYYIDQDRFYQDAVNRRYPPSMLERSYYIRLERSQSIPAKQSFEKPYTDNFKIDIPGGWERYKTIELFSDSVYPSLKTLINEADTLVFIDTVRLMIFKGHSSPIITDYYKFRNYLLWSDRSFIYRRIDDNYFLLDEVDITAFNPPSFRYYYRRIKNGADFIVPAPEPEHPFIIKTEKTQQPNPKSVKEKTDDMNDTFKIKDDITGWWVKYKTNSLFGDSANSVLGSEINEIDTLVFIDTAQLMIYKGLQLPITTVYKKFLMFLSWPQHSYVYRRIDDDHFLIDEFELMGVNLPKYRFYYRRIKKLPD
jgi:hypothetical protein